MKPPPPLGWIFGSFCIIIHGLNEECTPSSFICSAVLYAGVFNLTFTISTPRFCFEKKNVVLLRGILRMTVQQYSTIIITVRVLVTAGPYSGLVLIILVLRRSVRPYVYTLYCARAHLLVVNKTIYRRGTVILQYTIYWRRVNAITRKVIRKKKNNNKRCRHGKSVGTVAGRDLLLLTRRIL